MGCFGQKVSEELCVVKLKGDARFKGMLQGDAKFEEKLALGSKNDMKNFVNFNASSGV